MKNMALCNWFAFCPEREAIGFIVRHFWCEAARGTGAVPSQRPSLQAQPPGGGYVRIRHKHLRKKSFPYRGSLGRMPIFQIIAEVFRDEPFAVAYP